MDFKHIRFALKAARQARGWHLSDVAQACDSSPGYIHDIESGRTIPSLGMLNKLTKALNIDFSVKAKEIGVNAEGKKENPQ